jgi:hypothetical protein
MLHRMDNLTVYVFIFLAVACLQQMNSNMKMKEKKVQKGEKKLTDCARAAAAVAARRNAWLSHMCRRRVWAVLQERRHSRAACAGQKGQRTSLRREGNSDPQWIGKRTSEGERRRDEEERGEKGKRVQSRRLQLGRKREEGERAVKVRAAAGRVAGYFTTVPSVRADQPEAARKQVFI